MSELLKRLKERKVVRWAIAYVAGAWAVVEATTALGDMFGVPLVLQRGVVVALAFGLVLTIVLAWYHGERGRQRVSGTELLIIAAVFAAAGVTLNLMGRASPADALDAVEAAVGSADASPPPRSVAVLPFSDLSPDRDQAYFSEGIAEEVRSVLSRIDGLRVASSTSSLSVEDRQLDPREIGTRLGVAHLVEGSVRKNEDLLRIDARLVRVDDGFSAWSGRFEARAADIFALQDSIARSVARAFEIQPPGPDVVLAPRGQTTDHVAQDLYLRGRFAWNRRTQAGLEEAVELFEDAVARDSTYARALVGLGDAYAVLGFYDYRPPSEAFPRAEGAARAALAIDPTLAEPHATLGYAALYYRWDWPAAEGHFLRSIELDPGYPVAHQWYANYLTAMGRFDQAEEEMRTASELDPLSMIAFTAIGWVRVYARRYEAADRHLANARARDPEFQLAYLWASHAAEGLGNLTRAEQLARLALDLSDGNQVSRMTLARILGLEGRAEEARALIATMERERRQGYVPSYEIARAYVGLGDTERAIGSLEAAIDERSHSVAFLAVDPQLDPLRDTSRFQSLLGRAGLASVPTGR